MNNEKYNKILKCTLVGRHFDSEVYTDSYILLKDESDLESEYNIDLTGDLCFNTDFRIKDIESIIEIESLEDLYSFCKTKNISLDASYIHKKGLLVGGEKDYLILNDLTAYGYISEDYIENDKEKKKILNHLKVSEEIEL